MSAFFTSIGYESWGLHFLLWFPVLSMLIVLASGEASAKKTALVLAIIEFVATIPLGRMSRPSDIAQAALYLAEAEFITGTVLQVDGGRCI